MELFKHIRGCVFSIVVLGLGFAPAANAQNIQCGTDYTVKIGDFLSKIAEQFYGDPGAYELIYDGNRDVIGADPAVLSPGVVLQIPCAEGDNLQPNAQTATTSPTSTSTDADDSPFRIVLYGQWAPFLDKETESGGMLTEIVRSCLRHERWIYQTEV